MQYTVVATQLNVKRKATHWYTTITVVHNVHSGAQHIHDIEKFRLPEHQVSTMISELILSSWHFNISVLGWW